MTNIFHDYWEQELAYQTLLEDTGMRKVYICSPLSSQKRTVVDGNMRNARAYMFYARKNMNLEACAPHAFMPILLCDAIPAERAIALDFGLRLLEQCREMLVCGNRITKGMAGEIAHAVRLQMPITTFSENVYFDVRKEVEKNGGDMQLVSFNQEHYVLGFTEPVAHMKNVELFK